MSSGSGRTTTRVAVLGGGTVGSAAVQMIRGIGGVELLGVLVRNAERLRDFAGWRDLATTDASALEAADIVVEVAGGTGAMADLALSALRRGARLVTANKAALAERWDEFLPFLTAGKVWCEAAVMAGNPVVGALTGALRAARPLSLHAVLNGTCNVVLSDMENGRSYEEAVAAAQALGFAEADPTLDVDGIDAAHKLSVLTRLAFDAELTFATVMARTRGIRGIGAEEITAAAERGRKVRLVGSVLATESGWRAAVRPVSLPADHPLVTAGPTNALMFTGDPLGEVYVRGPGAGGGPTATAVVSDLLAALAGGVGHTPRAVAADADSAYRSAATADGGIEELAA